MGRVHARRELSGFARGMYAGCSLAGRAAGAFAACGLAGGAAGVRLKEKLHTLEARELSLAARLPDAVKDAFVSSGTWAPATPTARARFSWISSKGCSSGFLSFITTSRAIRQRDALVLRDNIKVEQQNLRPITRQLGWCPNFRAVGSLKGLELTSACVSPKIEASAPLCTVAHTDAHVLEQSWTAGL
jgi:hypothetical protein